MRGLVKTQQAPGAEYREDLPKPQIRENEVLVKVSAAAICGTDLHIYDWTEYARQRLKLPMVFGHEFSGIIEEMGGAVKGYAIGDRVAGETHIPCNACRQCRTGNQHVCESMKIIGVHTPGAFAEYIAVPVDCLWKLDDRIDDEQGALLEPMGVGVHGLLSGEVGAKTIVIMGAGPIGLCAAGMAHASGASLVIATDVVDRKLELAKKLGADVCVNTAKEAFVETVMRHTEGKGADVVIDYTGNVGAIRSGFDALRIGGRFTMVGLCNGEVPLDLNAAIIYKEARVNGVTGRLMYQTWYECERALLSGKFDLHAIIGGRYPLAAYKDAFQAIKDGAPGKMLLIP